MLPSEDTRISLGGDVNLQLLSGCIADVPPPPCPQESGLNDKSPDVGGHGILRGHRGAVSQPVFGEKEITHRQRNNKVT